MIINISWIFCVLRYKSCVSQVTKSAHVLCTLRGLSTRDPDSRLILYDEFSKVFAALRLPQAAKNPQQWGCFWLVDLGVGFWNRFAIECEYLVHVMREYERDKVK
jgi:hypothetical protein